jgi:Zn-dependent protease with chaperone function
MPATRRHGSLSYHFVSGEAVLSFMTIPREMYWRSREFAADAYAARLGQGPALAGTLEHDAMPYERPIPRMRYSRASHPCTKQRVAKLRAHHQPHPGDQQ